MLCDVICLNSCVAGGSSLGSGYVSTQSPSHVATQLIVMRAECIMTEYHGSARFKIPSNIISISFLCFEPSV